MFISDQFSPALREVKAAIQEGIEAIGVIREILEGKDTILVKPNMVINSDKATTNPVVVEAVVALLVEHGAKRVILGEAGNQNMEEAFDATGMDDIAQEYGIELADLNRSEQKKIRISPFLIYEEMPVAIEAAESDLIINVPVMKTHGQAMISVAMKNLKGVLSSQMKKEFHQNGLFESIVDLNRSLPEQLIIVDTTRAMEGDGPFWGDTLPINRVIVAQDSLAADVVCARIMGFELDEVHTIRLAREAGLGVDDPVIVGASIEEVTRSIGRPFHRPQDNVIQLPGINVMFGEKSCSGCRLTICSILELLKQQDKAFLQEIEDRGCELDFYIGDVIPRLSRDGCLVISLGNCAIKEAERDGLTEGDSHIFVRGCPPGPQPLHTAFGFIKEFVSHFDV